MNRIFRTFRYVVITALVVALAFTGLFPPLMVWADGGSGVAAPQPSNKCCCGTQDGVCCGMGCCGVRAPSPKNAPTPSPNQNDNRDGSHNPLALAVAKAFIELCDAEGNTSLGNSFSQSHPSFVAPSLQAQHVRLDT